jgi:hypothetical protein
MNWQYVLTFLQSSSLEIPIYYSFYRRQLKLHEVILLVTLANSFTHPWVFFGFMGSGWSYLVSVIAAESFAVGGETILHGIGGRLDFRRTFCAALLANLFSWQVAPIFTYALFF